ncbi:Ferredoxin-thioredoxin reductase subunit A2, chloroplastic-like protein [Drosera capensis]
MTSATATTTTTSPFYAAAPSPRTAAPPPLLRRRFSLTRPSRFPSLGVALKSSSVADDVHSPSPSSSDDPEMEELKLKAEKVGARIRVTAPLKVYHVPKVPEVELTGKEGVVKQFVGLWKGKRISANLPYKVEFEVEVEGRGVVRVSAHLKEDEFEIENLRIGQEIKEAFALLAYPIGILYKEIVAFP